MSDRAVIFESSHLNPFPLPIRGESFYREEIKSLFDYEIDEDEGINESGFAADLFLEENNLNDPNAVRVEIEEKKVGYLSRETAIIYRQKLKELGIENDVVGICLASIRGGFKDRETGKETHFGIRLDIDLNNLKVAPKIPNNIQTKTQYPNPISTQPQKDSIKLNTYIILIIIFVAFLCISFYCLFNLLHK